MGLYAEHVLPRIVDVACGITTAMPLRERTCADLHGRVIEIGFGSGLNVPFDPEDVTEVAAIEPADGVFDAEVKWLGTITSDSMVIQGTYTTPSFNDEGTFKVTYTP